MSIHHVKQHDIKWMPLTDEVRKLPIQDKSIYIVTNGDSSHAYETALSYEFKELARILSNPKSFPTHLAIIRLPDSATELPTSYEDYQVVTEEQESFRCKWDRPVGSFINHGEHTLVVVETAGESCIGCFFNGLKDKQGDTIYCLGNHCHAYERTDKKCVVFSPVTTIDCGPLEKGGQQ